MQQRERIFNVPTIVVTMIGIFVATFAVVNLMSIHDQRWWIWTLALVPGRYVASNIIYPGGTLADYTSLITHMFVHSDTPHLLINSVAFLAMGSAIARRIGAVKFLIFFALCGIGGVAAHLLSHWGENVPMVGASAAISGLMAAAVQFLFDPQQNMRAAMRQGDVHKMPRTGIVQSITNPKFIAIVAIWMVAAVIFGVTGVGASGQNSIAWEAHIGGFLAGLLSFQWFDDNTPVNALPTDYPSNT